MLSKEDIDMILSAIDMYGDICDLVGAENKFEATGIEDTLIRIRNGEYKIVARRSDDDWHV